MNDEQPAASNPIGSPTAKRSAGGAGRPSGLGQGGPQGNPTGPRDANDPGSTRYGKDRGTGANEPKHAETKETSGWTSRQGGDQSAGPGTEHAAGAHDAKENDR